MKTNAVIVLIVSSLLAVSCSKDSDLTITAQSDSIEVDTPEVIEIETSSIKQIKQLSDEVDLIKRRELLLQTMSEKTNSSDLAMIIKLHNDKKITTDEFRSLFWNGKISKELIVLLESQLKDDSQLSVLDKTLLMSISEGAEFDELLEKIKADTSLEFPVSLQSVLTDELLKNYLKDFHNINNDQVNLHEKLALTNNPKLDTFLIKLKRLMELSFFKRRLESKRLVSAKNQQSHIPREISSNFSLSYNYTIGRCGTYSNTLNFNTTTGSYGLQCNTETPSSANLQLFSKVGQDMFGTTIEVMLNSGVIGGYDRGHKENATTTLGFNLSGKIIIPKCGNPAYCNQIVTISMLDLGTAFGGAGQTNDGVSLTVNGNHLSNKIFSNLPIDVSTNDAEIALSFSGNKKHIGACCSSPNTYQKINLRISPGFQDISAIMLTEVKELFTFQGAFISGYPLMLNSSGFNNPPDEVQMLKNEISSALSSKSTLDNYRHIFYTALEVKKMRLDQLMKTNGKALEVMNENQLISSISDVIGRNMILPIINSKLLGFQNSSILNTQKNINEMFKSILLTNMNADNANEEIIKTIKVKMPFMDAQSMTLAENFIVAINEQATDRKDLLDQINAFQVEFFFMTKNIVLEMELLNLELAQFSEIQAPIAGNLK